MAKLLQRPGASYIRFQASSSQGRTFLVKAVWFTASQTEVKVPPTAQSPSPWRTHNKAFCAPGPWGHSGPHKSFLKISQQPLVSPGDAGVGGEEMVKLRASCSPYHEGALLDRGQQRTQSEMGSLVIHSSNA